MSEIEANIDFLNKKIPLSVKLVAVSKTKGADEILRVYNCGQKRFGENRVRELLEKRSLLPPDIEWHLIGHLQTNKVKNIVPYVSMIQSVDTYRLLTVINAESQRINRVTDCLLQIHIAEEETKFGFSIKELSEAGESGGFKNLKNVRICGLMGMATFTSDTEQVRKEFSYLRDCRKMLKKNFFASDDYFSEISMGMSGDFEIAIEEGSTIVRIGSLIFGERIKK
jgi:pyridoxal phosphate enzyme (YggS family)